MERHFIAAKQKEQPVYMYVYGCTERVPAISKHKIYTMQPAHTSLSCIIMLYDSKHQAQLACCVNLLSHAPQPMDHRDVQSHANTRRREAPLYCTCTHTMALFELKWKLKLSVCLLLSIVYRRVLFFITLECANIIIWFLSESGWAMSEQLWKLCNYTNKLKIIDKIFFWC